MLPEYDFADAVRGKYWKRFEQGTNLVLLEPDVRAAFPDSKSVKEALRGILRARNPKRGHSKTWPPLAHLAQPKRRRSAVRPIPSLLFSRASGKVSSPEWPLAPIQNWSTSSRHILQKYAS